jgi:hypothetical protein
MEMLQDNKYVGYIVNPVDGFFKRLLFKYRLKKTLKKLAPDYKEMVLIAECLEFLDMIYLFENKAEITGISASGRQGVRHCAIKIKANATQMITITLKDPDFIRIEIHNDGKLKSGVSFTDGNALIRNKYDELMFIHVNDYLMNSFTKVLLKYI